MPASMGILLLASATLFWPELEQNGSPSLVRRGRAFIGSEIPTNCTGRRKLLEYDYINSVVYVCIGSCYLCCWIVSKLRLACWLFNSSWDMSMAFYIAEQSGSMWTLDCILSQICEDLSGYEGRAHWGACESLADINFNTTKQERRQLGTAVGFVAFRDEFVYGKVKSWCRDTELPSQVAMSQPHVVFVGYVHTWTSKWSYIFR